jgi:RNA-binding protein
MLEPLTGAQRRKLKSLAQRLDATLTLGRAGASEAFVSSLNQELDRHELVKVKFAEFKDARHELAPELAGKTGSHLVWIIGHVAVFFRPQADPARRRINV